MKVLTLEDGSATELQCYVDIQNVVIIKLENREQGEELLFEFNDIDDIDYLIDELKELKKRIL